MPAIMLQAFVFLTDTVFNIYLYILVLRFMLVWVYADYSLPITQFIVKTTTFLVKPLRNIFPDYKRVECATIVLILIVSLIKQIIYVSITFGFSHFYSIFGLFLLMIADPLECAINILFVAVLFRAILSWLQPMTPINHILHQLTDPLLHPIQRVIPSVGGMDISPIFALVFLQLLMIVFVVPLAGEGASLAIR